MNTSRKYTAPPLVEAVCEFRFDPETSWDLTIPGLVYERLRDAFPDKRTTHGVALGFFIAESKVEQRIERGTRMQFVSKDEASLVQVDENMISVNHLRPYPGWETFRPMVSRAFEVYREIAAPGAIQRIGVRYINRIELPGPKVDLDQYLNFYPYLGPALPQDYGTFIAGISGTYADGRDGMRMQLNNVPAEEPDALWFSLDIDYFLATPGSVSFDAALNWVDDAHERVEQLFEGCVTDRLRRELGEIRE